MTGLRPLCWLLVKTGLQSGYASAWPLWSITPFPFWSEGSMWTNMVACELSSRTLPTWLTTTEFRETRTWGASNPKAVGTPGRTPSPGKENTEWMLLFYPEARVPGKDVKSRFVESLVSNKSWFFFFFWVVVWYRVMTRCFSHFPHFLFLFFCAVLRGPHLSLLSYKAPTVLWMNAT